MLVKKLPYAVGVVSAIGSVAAMANTGVPTVSIPIDFGWLAPWVPVIATAVIGGVGTVVTATIQVVVGVAAEGIVTALYAWADRAEADAAKTPDKKDDVQASIFAKSLRAMAAKLREQATKKTGDK